MDDLYAAAQQLSSAPREPTKVLGSLGLRLRFVERDRPWAGWMGASAPRPLSLIGTPFDGQPTAARPSHYDGACFRDPDGNKLCVCCYDPVPAQCY